MVIKAEAFFNLINFAQLEAGIVSPPFKPDVSKKHVYSLLLMRACEYKMKLRLSLCCPLDILKLMG